MDKPILIRKRQKSAKRAEPEEMLNPKRAIEAVAYLLQYATDAGNEPLDGFVALGLGRLLEQIAERMR